MIWNIQNREEVSWRDREREKERKIERVKLVSVKWKRSDYDNAKFLNARGIKYKT
jgi:hypothetical protein